MTQMNISGQVLNGRILPEQSLAPLEGQHIIGTLTVVPKASANGSPAETTSERESQTKQQTAAGEEIDPEPPEWLQVEKDLYFPMTVPEISLGKVNIRVEEGKPCIILPEELPDD